MRFASFWLISPNFEGLVRGQALLWWCFQPSVLIGHVLKSFGEKQVEHTALRFEAVFGFEAVEFFVHTGKIVGQGGTCLPPPPHYSPVV